MTIRLRRYAICLALGGIVLGPAALAAPSSQEVSTKATLECFQMAVNDYVTLRWHATRDLPSASGGIILQEIMAALEAQVRAVSRARQGARPGEIFTSDVAALFRKTIAFTLDEYHIDVRDLLAEINREAPRNAPTVRVNERFPWLRGAAMPMVLIVALPSLPYELQYRLVGRDLVLLDADLGLVVDILPNALPKN